ncbi:MAG TPA: DUF1566 domain-containing protein [Epsilonproteobacteria bacterium]|nr:DUF1566 domain-containing protein [Campylobacterota bacterium]
MTATLSLMRARHILVVSDSCYAGVLTREGSLIDGLNRADKKYYTKLYQKRSRNVLTGGGMEPVQDGDGPQADHSVFANGFIKMLSGNTSPIFALEEKFGSVKRYVMLNADQTPNYGDLRKTGHMMGGDFIFLDRKAIAEKRKKTNPPKLSATVIPAGMSEADKAELARLRQQAKRNKQTKKAGGWDKSIYRGERSYSKNTAHTVKDNLTGLIWQKSGSKKKMNWTSAKAYCSDLSLDGFDDWRLPMMEELYYLGDVSKYNPAIDEKFDVKNDWYWSSTEFKNDSSSAWNVDFNYGYDGWYNKTYEYYVLCVRGQ